PAQPSGTVDVLGQEAQDHDADDQGRDRLQDQKPFPSRHVQQSRTGGQDQSRQRPAHQSRPSQAELEDADYPPQPMGWEPGAGASSRTAIRQSAAAYGAEPRLYRFGFRLLTSCHPAAIFNHRCLLLGPECKGTAESIQSLSRQSRGAMAMSGKKARDLPANY